MSRYFFHVLMKADSVVRDRAIIQFRDLAAARADAEEAVRQTIIEKKAANAWSRKTSVPPCSSLAVPKWWPSV
jgi:hypothetical protein